MTPAILVASPGDPFPNDVLARAGVDAAKTIRPLRDRT